MVAVKSHNRPHSPSRLYPCQHKFLKLATINLRYVNILDLGCIRLRRSDLLSEVARFTNLGDLRPCFWSSNSEPGLAQTRMFYCTPSPEARFAEPRATDTPARVPCAHKSSRGAKAVEILLS